MRLTFGIALTAVVLLDYFGCFKNVEGLENFNIDISEYFPPPQHLQIKGNFVPEHWIHYPYPYYYDAKGVIRDYTKPGAEGLVFNRHLVGIRLRNGENHVLTHHGAQYIIRLLDGKVFIRNPGTSAQLIDGAVSSSRLSHGYDRRS